MAESGVAAKSAPPAHKKRGGKRTARACDECRLRKQKCDGLQSCEQCQITDRYCTYNLSAANSSGSGTRIRILEDRLRRARAYLLEAQRRTPSLADVNFDALLGPTDPNARNESNTAEPFEEHDAQEKLDSMMDAYGRLTLTTNDQLGRDFYGPASGLAWIQKTGNYFDDTDSADANEYDPTNANNSAAVQLFDAPLPPLQAIDVEQTTPDSFPPRETASQLMNVVFKQVYPMYHFLFEDDFQKSTDRIYDIDPDDYEEQDQSFLTLFNLVMALGYLYSKDHHEQLGCRASIAEAMRLFITGRSMVDISHLRTIVSLQSIICLILFLISTARMASAHAFLGAACASALRQGLHFRSTHESSFPSAEKNVRRRVFWAVMNLDMYVCAILGLPQFMDLSAVDPALDLTIEIARREVKSGKNLTPKEGLALSASAKHIELMRIVFKAQHTLYPKPTDPPDVKKQNNTISLSVAKLKVVEDQFQQWANSLTDILSHPDDSIEAQSIKYEMHCCYYYAQIVLYRAFLHYLAKQHEGQQVNERQLSYAKTCVRMAVKIIEVTVEHQRRGLMCPASWPSCYSVFISTVCLIFAHATRVEGSDVQENTADIENGIRLLACTACTTDTGSVRCLEILRRLINRVKYAVDIDLDEICSATKPCCAVNFHSGPPDPSFNIEELMVPARHPSEAPFPPTRSTRSSLAQSHSNIGDTQAWALSPDATMTRPSLAPVEYSTQGPQITQPDFQPSQTYYNPEEEMVEVPYGGTFSWPQHEFHAAAARLGQPLQSVEQASPMQNEQDQRRPSGEPRRITAEDIAAFMHINAVDEPWARLNDGSN